MRKEEILSHVAQTIETNRTKDPKFSYSARLFQDAKGVNKLLEKIGEEATELVIAAKDEKKIEILNEMADLWVHCLMLLVHFGLKPEEVLQILFERNSKKIDQTPNPTVKTSTPSEPHDSQPKD